MLKLAQRVSPVALKAVVGTKADLIEQRKVESQKVVVRHTLSPSINLSYNYVIYSVIDPGVLL